MLNSNPDKAWDRVEELYHEALSKPPAERIPFLESACGADAELRREVESLLAAVERDGALLEVPALEVAARILAASPTSSLQGQQPSLGPGGGLPGGSGIREASMPGTVRRIAGKIFRHAPWWMSLLAAVFAADCFLRAYGHIFGPENWGFAVRTKGNQNIITLVNPSSAMERACLKPGDVLLGVDGIALKNSMDLKVNRWNRKVGRSYDLEIEREGQRLHFTLRAERIRIFQNWEQAAQAVWQINALLLLAVALLIAFARPFDPLARAGALALATLSVGLYLSNFPPGYAAVWRELPRGVGDLLWIPNICVFLAGPVVLTFFALFPRPLFRARWAWAIIWLPTLGYLWTYIYNTFLIVYRPSQAYGNILLSEGLLRPSRILGLYGLASVGALVANTVRLTDANDRRRLRVLLIGGGAAVLPGSLRLLVWKFGLPSGTSSGPWLGLPDILVALMFALFPVCFAYSILRHRLLDIRIIIRQGIQYAATRGALLSVVPILGVILIADLLAHGDQPLIGILKMRGWIYAVLAAAAIAAHSQRRRWGEAVDRRFFREQYDARRVLREVSAGVSRTRSFTAAASGTVARIEAALHPEFAAILRRSSEDTTFQPIASSPSDKVPPLLDAKSGLVSIVRNLGEPLEVILGKSGWLERQLPFEEIELLRRSRIDLVLPISMALEGDEALLVLGAKRSEQPYTGEDQDLLAAIASNLGLLFERPEAPQAPPREGFEECPLCGTCYDAGSGRCAKESAGLSPVHMPRTLAGRYRLERRLGHGGMGAVYEASDLALGRLVAVKVLREDRLGSAEAAQRFQREARAAAGFAHPNVVTIHDYGIVAGTRSFIVMELLEGATLRKELKSRTRLPPDRTLEIFCGVCSAVEAAHCAHIIHRDLKPENIFLAHSSGPGGQMVKVLDFGIAKFLSGEEQGPGMAAIGETDIGILVGTPGYISPEQLLGERPALSWDLWALAVTVYETLTGALPFPVEGKDSWRQLALAGKYMPLSEHLTEPPVPWEEFFARSLAADREMRPQSAAEFLRRLEQALA